ncbi:MAG: YrzE family protein [Acidimicrobiales bacterium]
MRGIRKVESGKERKMVARDAGMGPVSLISILAGTLVAFAAFAILLAVVAGILAAVGFDTADLVSIDYQKVGIISAIVTFLVLFVAYFFGGYIAGRLARRAGALNGGLVFLLAILIGVVVAVLVATQSDTQAIATNVRVVGVPTSGEDYRPLATIAGVASLLAMLGGAILGGVSGERWHGKLAARAMSPDVGPEAAGRTQMVEAEQRREGTTAGREGTTAGGPQRRPWAQDQPAQPAQPAQATQPVPAAHSAPPAEEPAHRGPQDSSRWNEAEARAWGTPAPVDHGTTDPAVDDAGRTVATDDERPGGVQASSRPRRDRPLRRGEGRGR